MASNFEKSPKAFDCDVVFPKYESPKGSEENPPLKKKIYQFSQMKKRNNKLHEYENTTALPNIQTRIIAYLLYFLRKYVYIKITSKQQSIEGK